MEVIQRNTALAERRRVYFLIWNDSGAAWTGSVTGVKAQLSFQGAAEAASNADVVRVGGLLHYVQLTQPEADVGLGRLLARVAAATGRLEAPGGADLVPYDIFSTAPIEADVKALAGRLWNTNAVPLDVVRT